jgi:hypothetical protein
MSAFTKCTFGRCLTFSTFPLDRLSYMVKLLVKFDRFLHRWEPMNPAPPVTNMFFPLSWFMKFTTKTIFLFGSV